MFFLVIVQFTEMPPAHTQALASNICGFIVEQRDTLYTNRFVP